MSTFFTLRNYNHFFVFFICLCFFFFGVLTRDFCRVKKRIEWKITRRKQSSTRFSDLLVYENQKNISLVCHCVTHERNWIRFFLLFSQTINVTKSKWKLISIHAKLDEIWCDFEWLKTHFSINLLYFLFLICLFFFSFICFFFIHFFRSIFKIWYYV